MTKLISIFIFLTIVTIIGNAQETKGYGLFTDRDVYVSGETLLAKIYLPTGNPSRIVHLDLVSPHNKRVSGASLEIRNGQANGFLLLPDSLSTGTYLLRAYTKNTAAKTKVIRSLWISNRFNGLDKISQISQLSGVRFVEEKNTPEVAIEGLDQNYQTNRGVTASVKIDETYADQVDGPLLISVAQTDPAFQSANYVCETNSDRIGLPEKKGIILSGTVTDRKTEVPASGATVFMSIPDSIPGFQYYQTNKDGRFYFQLEDYYGPTEAFIQCFANDPAQRLKLRMDEPFAEPDSNHEFTQTPVTEEFKQATANKIDILTFQKIFRQDQLKFQSASKKSPELYPYYGTPSNIVNPQLFIDLPNFTEISRELLPGVKFRNYNNEPTLRVINQATRNYFGETPLLLINGIPIRNLNVIKDMGTSDIKRIEISQSERFYGNIRFPGIVALYTTKSDYSRIPETDQFLRLKLDAIQVPATLSEPAETSPAVPDLRQVFYWNPSAETRKNLPINFNTSSIVGKFSLVVRGRLKDGTIIKAEKQFEVK